MTSKGKITWGGNSEQIAANAAKSETNGNANTSALVNTIGKNSALDGKPYALNFAAKQTSVIKMTGIYLLKKKPMRFTLLKISSM